jgi:hypothetical protein
VLRLAFCPDDFPLNPFSRDYSRIIDTRCLFFNGFIQCRKHSFDYEPKLFVTGFFFDYEWGFGRGSVISPPLSDIGALRPPPSAIRHPPSAIRFFYSPTEVSKTRCTMFSRFRSPE